MVSKVYYILQVGELKDFFIFKLPETDHRIKIHSLRDGDGKMMPVTQALENDTNVIFCFDGTKVRAGI